MSKPLFGVALAMVVAAGVANSALAGGTLSLKDVLDRTGGTPQLKADVDEKAPAASKDSEAVECTATRVGNQYALIGGERIGPYSCVIGDKVLEVDSVVEFLDEKGKVIDKSDEDSVRGAAGVRETDYKWTWRQRGK